MADRGPAPSASPAHDGPVRALPAATRLSLRVKGVPVSPAASPQRGEVERAGGAPGEGEQPSPVRVLPPHPVASRLDLSPPGRGFAPQALSLPINRYVPWGERLVARLGPDEWLLLGPDGEAEAMQAEVSEALSGRFHALVDVSHRSVAFAVEGPHGEDILNAGCPLDLHPSAYPPGSATRTILGKAEIVLLRSGDDSFRVECWRSFGAYVHGFLTEAARDVGG